MSTPAGGGPRALVKASRDGHSENSSSGHGKTNHGRIIDHRMSKLVLILSFMLRFASMNQARTIRKCRKFAAGLAETAVALASSDRMRPLSLGPGDRWNCDLACEL